MERIYHWSNLQKLPLEKKNAEGSPSDKKKMIANRSLVPHKETKFNLKDKYLLTKAKIITIKCGVYNMGRNKMYDINTKLGKRGDV